MDDRCIRSSPSQCMASAKDSTIQKDTTSCWLDFPWAWSQINGGDTHTYNSYSRPLHRYLVPAPPSAPPLAALTPACHLRMLGFSPNGTAPHRQHLGQPPHGVAPQMSLHLPHPCSSPQSMPAHALLPLSHSCSGAAAAT